MLGAALIDFIEKAFGKALIYRSAEGFVRYLNDDRITDALQFEGGRGLVPWLIPRAAALWFRFVEALENASPALARVIDFLSRRIVQRLVDYFDKYKDRPLIVPRQMASAWKMKT